MNTDKMELNRSDCFVLFSAVEYNNSSDDPEGFVPHAVCTELYTLTLFPLCLKEFKHPEMILP